MTMTSWPVRRWLVAVLGMVAVALLIGVPTGIIRTPFYHRMTPVQWWNYPVWAVTALLSGLILATYIRTEAPEGATTRLGLGGGVLSFLAVGCPVCNKVVVFAIGVSAALKLWAPVQPVLGLLSLGLLGWALSRRLGGERTCPAPGAPAPSRR